MEHLTVTGMRGCAGTTKRGGKERMCQQEAIHRFRGKGYCYYHHPEKPKKFGEGYLTYRTKR